MTTTEGAAMSERPITIPVTTRERKTIDVEYVRGAANYFLAEGSTDDQVGERKGVAELLTMILLRANRYRGFSYLQIEFNPDEEGGGVKTFGDETRRHYG
jgi:hypothetical protein